jgi:DNA-binding LacI/PurR family transcriptional regulator
MVTMKDIAQIVGVSESTVSRVMSKPPDECPVSKKLQEKIRKVAEKLEYQPNLMARGLATRKSGNIGLVIYRYEHLTHPVMTQVLSGVASVISHSRYSLLIEAIYQPGKENEAKQRLSGLFARRQVDGLIIVAHETEPVEILELMKEEYPFVLANFYVPGLNADSVRVNFKKVGKSILTYFAELDHKDIAILPGPKKFGSITNNETEDTVSGIQATATELGVQISSERIIYTAYEELEAYNATLNLLAQEEKPTAIYAADDAVAMGVLRAAQEQGIQVPADLSILCGADTQTARFAPVPLSAIQIPYTDIGLKAAGILLAELQQESQGNQQQFLPFEIISRQSCARRVG